MKIRRKSIPPVALSLTIVAIATAGVAYSPTLYRMFCAATGYGGTVSVNRALKPQESDSIGPAITVRFDANTAPGLEWDFKPVQRAVQTHSGVPTTVYYRATNTSDRAIVGRATYNVTPDSAGYYFNKTECFCFTEQKLAPGESADMPIVFFIDPEMATDIDTRSIRTITLSYTFFQQDSSEEALAAAKPLREESEARARELATAETADFSNRTPHAR
ncbi:MAG: cytochrome c oxidase assembly protein [Parvibaculum sp.]|jgi:cytochrome c oxidase assembly protein subunit 11|uniref:cytochrome c oxidase assembly protein n=1 Tax=Parvibaculum sp. TaxID=2024848 RepID=UPI000CBD9435|nr:cytochrome c oxidase assembly protein [Parvibaculum sp.]MDZ4379889.1 cytochrome c oxidase assembly protein [Parvibaculum sp.]PKP78771.1 MAG: cytochrome c oxidase assembly protein [Alphaproteobacteria bacterium HGW-Alphaproteobacteria-3]